MPKQYVVQSSFLSGVLDPRAAARVETDAYNNGLLRGVNIEPSQLGGMKRRRGLRFRDTLPNQLTRVTAGVTITAPNGGTTANANDDSETVVLTTTTNVGTNDPYVVVHYDLGAATDVLFADARAIKSSGGSSTQFRIQYSTDNAAWTTLGDVFEVVDTTSRSYRRGSTTATSARYWRIVKIGGTDMGAVTITLGDFSLWTDTGTVSAVRLFAFEVSTEEHYLIAATDRSLQVYSENGVLEVALPSPYESADLAGIDAAQNQDSMVFVCEDHAPRFLIPEFDTFYADPIIFTYVPQYDFDDATSPTPTSEVQVITFGTSFAAGDTFQIELEGARTASISYAGDSGAADQAATAANLAREIQKLYTVLGFTGVTCARTGARQYTVTFAGASAKPYELMSGITLSTKATTNVEITITRSATGVSRHEDAWSSTRGWPRTVTFFEGRMYFGGTRDLVQTLFGSKVNQILDFEIGEARDDDGIQVTLANQQLNSIEAVFSGRALQLFTSGGEFRYVKPQGDPITPADAPSNQTQFGSAKIRPVSTDGATIFTQRTRKAIRDFRYDYEEDAYNSLGVSSFAPHLINNVIGMTAWNGSDTDEISLVFVVNNDGTMAILSSRRDSDIRAWVQWTTQGAFRDAAAVVEDMYFAVERTINDVTYLFLEQGDETLYTDCAVSGPLVSTVDITNVALASSAVWSTYTHNITTNQVHGLTAGDLVSISGVIASGHYEIDDGVYAVVSVQDTTHFRIKVKNLTGFPTGSYVSGGSFPGGSDTTVSGLDHLDGAECRVKADGFVLENRTPVAGEITIEYDASTTEVGLNYDPEITPLSLVVQTPNGVNAMRKRRITGARVRVHETLGLRVNGRALPDRRMDISNFDEPVEPVTGIIGIEETTNWDRDQDKLVSFTQVDPLPMHILGMDVAMEWNE